jgi:uncharacterized protein YkwD
MKRIPLCCLLLLGWFMVTGQPSSVVVEAYIRSIAPGPVFHLEVIEIRNGQLDVKSLPVTLVPGQDHLLSGIRRFRSQRWLLTLVKGPEGDQWRLRSAYGLGNPSDPEPQSPFPGPVMTDPDPVEMLQEHARVNIGEQEQQIVEMTNIQRWNNGMLAPLKQVDLLHNSADGHSEAMADLDFFAHCNLNTLSAPWDRMTAAGYSWNAAAENIAAGSSTTSGTMNQWMNSSGHRTNILSTSYREIGVGYQSSTDGQIDRLDRDGNCQQDDSGGPYVYYWTQNFGRRNSIYPVVIEREVAETPERTVDLYVYGPSNAVSMRFSNDGTSWSGWVAYTPDYTWELSGGSGLKTVYSQISTGANGGGTIYSASDEIQLHSDCDPMVFSNTTLNGTQTYTSCEIIADPNVHINGQIIFQAGTVVLGENVDVPLGATLNIEIQN